MRVCMHATPALSASDSLLDGRLSTFCARLVQVWSLDSFVLMSSDVRTAAASGQSRAQPAEPGLSALVHRQRGMKRVRE